MYPLCLAWLLCAETGASWQNSSGAKARLQSRGLGVPGNDAQADTSEAIRAGAKGIDCQDLAASGNSVMVLAGEDWLYGLNMDALSRIQTGNDSAILQRDRKETVPQCVKPLLTRCAGDA